MNLHAARRHRLGAPHASGGVGFAQWQALHARLDDYNRWRETAATRSSPLSAASPGAGNECRVTPTHTCQSTQGPCRVYSVDGLIGGGPATLAGIADGN